MIRFLNPWRRRGSKAQSNRLPPELVEAIKDLSCIFRDFQVDESGERITRPLTMNFMGGPLYLDDPDAVARRVRAHFPELTARQGARIQSMVGNRVQTLRRDARDREELMRVGREGRESWMEETRRITGQW